MHDLHHSQDSDYRYIYTPVETRDRLKHFLNICLEALVVSVQSSASGETAGAGLPGIAPIW